MKVNGQLVQANYDIYAAAGNKQNKAVALTLTTCLLLAEQD